MRCCPAKPIVVAAPRSGFSLLISIIGALSEPSSRNQGRTSRESLIEKLVSLSSFYLVARYKRAFARCGIEEGLIFNGEFHLAIGGPKWLRPDDKAYASFRKYFGVRGAGDFLLVTSHPRELLEYDAVIHSHTAPSLWLDQHYYDDCPKFSSIRNPLGIINSACFSLNAMASEYIQRYMPDESEGFIRQRLALYKLTDLDVVDGLIKFLKDYLDDYLSVGARFRTMRWEDLIQHPAETICTVAAALGIDCGRAEAEAIWSPMDHVNLLQFHKHNYRRGKGIVGDWANSLVNEHIDLFRQHGFDIYLKELGYPTLPDLDRADYSPFQILAERYLLRGEVYRHTGDGDLFNFAFNKSNIDATKFGFKCFPARRWTQVERSTMTCDDIVEAVSDAAEDTCEKVNRITNTALAMSDSDAASFVRDSYADLIGEIDDRAGLELMERLFPIGSAP
jgi:hypothetical protein